MYCAIFVIATPWLNFLRSYCGDFYGSVLWELAHPSVEDVCINWRKGLKRVWELPTRTHSALVAPLCGLLPLRFELACRCSRFIVKCLNSSNSIVRFVAGPGVLHRRMHSPIGRNAQHSATVLGTPLSKLASINKKMAWIRQHPVVYSGKQQGVVWFRFFKHECYSRVVIH